MNMKKYFHELTDQEFKELPGNITYEQLAKEYPQPDWCEYPDATAGLMGCWSLMSMLIKNRDCCKNCECCKDFNHLPPNESNKK